ncbi:MAG TPA: CPBP family intramembrane glutamic endopeptidase [Acidimicrobiales bacterium]|nr:CPBP family intramembrane glutamic endopeptidase [Acidimicrobiales bacterium]
MSEPPRPPGPAASPGSSGPSRPVTDPGEGAETAPVTSRDAGAWIICAGAGFVAGQLASVVLLEVVAVVSGHGSDVWKLAARVVPPAWVVVSELVGLWTGFVAGVVVASTWRGTRHVRRDMGLWVRPWDPVIGVAAGLAGQILLLPLLYLPLEHVIPHLDQRLKEPAQHLTGGFTGGGSLAVIGALTVLVVPVVEELFFRGLVLRSLLRLLRGAGPRAGPVAAVLVTGLIFGLAHFEALELLGLVAFGVVLSAMAVRFRRLGPSIFAHATFNFLAILSVAGVLH